MGLDETASNIAFTFIMGVLVLTPIALIDGYYTQQKILSELDGIKQEIAIKEETDW